MQRSYVTRNACNRNACNHAARRQPLNFETCPVRTHRAPNMCQERAANFNGEKQVRGQTEKQAEARNVPKIIYFIRTKHISGGEKSKSKSKLSRTNKWSSGPDLNQRHMDHQLGTSHALLNKWCKRQLAHLSSEQCWSHAAWIISYRKTFWKCICVKRFFRFHKFRCSISNFRRSIRFQKFGRASWSGQVGSPNVTYFGRWPETWSAYGLFYYELFFTINYFTFRSSRPLEVWRNGGY